MTSSFRSNYEFNIIIYSKNKVKTNQGDNNFKIKVKLNIFSVIFCVFRSEINFKIYSFEFIGSVLKLKIHFLISGAFLVFDSLCKGTKLSVIDH